MNISGSLIPNENDLIEVRIDVAAFGMTNLVLERSSTNLMVFPSYQKGDAFFFDTTSNRTDPLTLTSSTLAVFVEWAALTNGTADLKLVDGTTNTTIDALTFHTFTNITIALGGLGQVPSIPTDPNHGMFLIADTLYAQGYDVMKFDEDEVAAFTNPGAGAPYDEIENAVNNRLVTDVAILGYSQGGGSTYNLSAWLDQRRVAGDIAAYNLLFTAYIDAVRDDGPNAEGRLPVVTQWHLNLYQQEDDVLDGVATPGGNENINVEESVLFPFEEISHTDIDDALEVIEWILMRYLENVER
jgi:hypothetical protein